MKGLIKLRQSDKTLLTDICNIMATKGRKALLLQNKIFFLEHKNPDVRITIKQGEDSDQIIGLKAKCHYLLKPHPTDASKTVRIFEGCHLKDFVDEQVAMYQKRTPTIPAAKTKLFRNLTIEKYLYNILHASSNSLTANRVRDIFNWLAELLDISLMESLLAFLKFCRKGCLPIRAINHPGNLVPQSQIDDIENYIANEQHKQQFQQQEKEQNGLKFVLNKGESDSYKAILGKAEDKLYIPNEIRNKDLEDISTLLTWKYQLTPDVIGRDSEFERLQMWLDEDKSKSIFLLHGNGGVGKTRLAFELARRADSQGWSAGAAGDSVGDFIGCWGIGRQGILLIIDYPEQRNKTVKRLLRAIGQLDLSANPNICIRVLLISRSFKFLHDIDKEVGLPSRAMLINGLKECNDLWTLFDTVWQALYRLKNKAEKQDKLDIHQSPLPIERKDFDDWLGKSDMHTTPLMVMALSIYLFQLREKTTVNLEELTTPEILRYFSEREARLIKKEVREYNKSEEAEGAKLKYQSVCLIKAVAAVTDGFEMGALRSLIEDLNKPDVDIDFKPPIANHLTNLSIADNNFLPPLTPDILAADFLTYCLNEYAAAQEGEWIIATIGIIQIDDNNGNYQSIQGKFVNLDKLVFDAKNMLGYHLQWLDNLKSYIKRSYRLCLWITKNIEGIYLGATFNLILIDLLNHSIENSCHSENKALYMTLGKSLAEFCDIRSAISAFERALELNRDPKSQDEIKHFYNSIMPLITMITNITHFYNYSKIKPYCYMAIDKLKHLYEIDRIFFVVCCSHIVFIFKALDKKSINVERLAQYLMDNIKSLELEDTLGNIGLHRVLYQLTSWNKEYVMCHSDKIFLQDVREVTELEIDIYEKEIRAIEKIIPIYPMILINWNLICTELSAIYHEKKQIQKAVSTLEHKIEILRKYHKYPYWGLKNPLIESPLELAKLFALIKNKGDVLKTLDEGRRYVEDLAAAQPLVHKQSLADYLIKQSRILTDIDEDATAFSSNDQGQFLLNKLINGDSCMSVLALAESIYKRAELEMHSDNAIEVARIYGKSIEIMNTATCKVDANFLTYLAKYESQLINSGVLLEHQSVY